MKKIISTLILIAIFSASKAQSPRMQLIEEFSGENCGPCAAVNPGFFGLLLGGSNPTKIIPLKYQDDIPSAGPVLFYQASGEANTRESYYANTSAPNGRHDGNYWSGNPGSFTQSMINTRAATTSPFTLTLNHAIDASHSNIIITGTVVASASRTYTNLSLHLAVVEKEIDFEFAPGSNGETLFHNVMRKMVPNASGTTLASTWTVGQTYYINFTVPLKSAVSNPAPNSAVPYYDINELKVIGFLQENTSKNVHQAGESAIVLVSNYARAETITNISPMSCVSTFTPTVTIKNHGSNNLTSTLINYQLDGGAVQSIVWTGNLAPGASSAYTLPVQTTTAGSHTFVAYTSYANGIADYNALNALKESVSVSFGIVANPGLTALPFNEGFTGATFVPTGWILENTEKDAIKWARQASVGSAGSTSACATIEFYNAASGTTDILNLPPYDFSQASAPLNIDFDVAYAQYNSAINDSLFLEVSTNCGTSWTKIWQEWGATLANGVASTTSQYTPTTSDWRNELVNINSYLGNANVLFRFRAVSDYGNDLFLDDINISGLSVPAVTTAQPITYCQNATASALTATGTSLLWYTTLTGGVGSSTAPTPVTTSVGTTSYYVSQTVGSESQRARIDVQILAGAPSAPLTVASVNYCQYATAAPLTATGTSLLWYTVATGGTGVSTAPTPSTAVAGTTPYYVSQSNSCGEGPRTQIDAIIAPADAAPVVTTPVNYCQTDASTALTASGSNLLWYASLTGGFGITSAPVPSTVAASNKNYYVTARTGTCESDRTAINVIVTAKPVPPTPTGTLSYCVGNTATALTATGTGIMWYSDASGSSPTSTAPTPNTSVAGTFNFYNSQTVAGCTSIIATVQVPVTSYPGAPGVTNPTYCVGVTPTALTATGTSLLWHTSTTAGTGSVTAPTPATSAAGTTTYYVTQTVNNCTSTPRTPISVVVNALPAAPSVSTDIVYCKNELTNSLEATGSNLLWYTSITGGVGSPSAITPLTNVVGSIDYFVSQTINSCESPRATINVKTNSCTGIEEVTTSGAFRVYPNPFTTDATINIQLVKSENVKIEVYNMIGEKVYSENKGQLPVGTTNTVINGESLKPGIYSVNVNIGGKLLTKKLVLTK